MARGFTLLELMFVLAAAAILLSLGVPSFQGAVNNMRMTSSVNDLVAALQMARSEAIKRRVPVVICTSSNGSACDASGSWHDGWIVWHDDNNDDTMNEADQVLLRHGQMRRHIEVDMAANQALPPRLKYSPTGFPDVGGLGATGVMVFCNSKAGDYYERVVVVPQTGRPVTVALIGNEYGASCP